MKFTVLTAHLIMLMLTITSCGKKTKITDDSKNTGMTSPSTSELYFHTYRDLEFAVSSNDLFSLKRILSDHTGINLNLHLNDGETLLITAIKKDFIEIRNYLLEKNADPNVYSINQESPLIAAVRFNRENTVKILLDLNINLDKKNSHGQTALHIALQEKFEPLALLLIKEGANLEILDRHDRNAYQMAQDYNLTKAVELIGSILKVESGTPDLASFKNILSQGDYKTLKSILSRYPTIANDYIVLNPFAILVNNLNENTGMKISQLLLQYQADINGPQDAETTPLIMATAKDKYNFTLFLLSSGANPHLTDKEGKSALIHAIEQNNIAIVELLLSYSAAKKYSVKKNRKKISYNACSMVRKIKKKLTNEQQIITNQKIHQVLDCYLFDWPF